jgi:hypothetical protein
LPRSFELSALSCVALPPWHCFGDKLRDIVSGNEFGHRVGEGEHGPLQDFEKNHGV